MSSAIETKFFLIVGTCRTLSKVNNFPECIFNITFPVPAILVSDVFIMNRSSLNSVRVYAAKDFLQNKYVE